MITNTIKKQILSTIKPSREEAKKLKLEANDLLSLISSSAKGLGIKCSPFIGGSFGKGTYLKDSFDVDIFCRFDLKYEDKELSFLAQKILDHAKISYHVQKGSRDYFSGKFKSLYFEVVPNYYITSLKEAKNSTDYSPYHVEFVQSHAKKNNYLLDEIRLTKQFFKAQFLYGAESYINGFSGHVIDLLLIHYGTLNNFLESAKTWGEKTCIDVASFYSSDTEIFQFIDSSKHSNLLIVDSILKDRNAAKALSEEMYFKFLNLVTLHECFNTDHFIIEKNTYKQLSSENKLFAKKGGLHAIEYILDLEDIESEDIVGSKLLKLLSKIEQYYKSFDFICFDSSFTIFFEEKKCLYSLFFEYDTLPSLKLLKGPEVFRKEALLAFSKAKDNIFVRGKRAYAYEKRNLVSLNKVPSLSLDSFKELSSKDMSFVKKLSFNNY